MSEPLSAEDLAGYRAMLEAATPGPWITEPDTGAGRVWVQFTSMAQLGDLEPLFNVRSRESYAQRAKDAALIAAAPGVIGKLLNEVERLRSELDGPWLEGMVDQQGEPSFMNAQHAEVGCIVCRTHGHMDPLEAPVPDAS